MKHTEVTRPSVEGMVNAFYAKVLKDPKIGPFFIRALGEDLDGGKWYEHLRTLYDFWMLMMTGKKGYRGDPFPPHAFLGPLSREDFEQWLRLFEDTVREHYVEEVAQKFVGKATLLAEQFMEYLDVDGDDDEW